MRLARVVLAHRIAACLPISIDRPDQYEARDAFGNRTVEGCCHQFGVQIELPVVDADEVNQGVDITHRGANGGGILTIPGDDLGQRIRAEARLQRFPGAANDAVRVAGLAQGCRNGLADGAGGAEKSNTSSHERSPVIDATTLVAGDANPPKYGGEKRTLQPPGTPPQTPHSP